MTDVLVRGAAQAARPDNTIVATILDLPLDLMLIIVLLAGLCFQTLTIIYLYSQLKQKRAEEEQGSASESGADPECSDHPDAIVVRVDEAGQVAGMSAGARRFFGARGEDALGRDFLGGLVPVRESTGRDLAALWHELARGGEDQAELESEALVEGRKRVWVRWRLRRRTRPGVRSEARPGLSGTEWFCLGQDVTEDREREQRLVMARRALEQTVDGAALAALDGTVLFANAAWMSMHGFSDKDDVIGQNLSVFHSPEQMIQEVIPFTRHVIREGAKQGEMGHVRRDGTPFTSQISVSLIHDDQGEPVGYVGVARDGTKQRKHREDLKRSLAWLTSLAESTDAAILVADRNSRPQFYNTAYAELIKMSLGMTMGPDAEPLKAMPEDVRTHWQAWCQQALSGSHLRFRRNIPFLDGTTRGYDVAMHPIEQEGEVVGLSIFFLEAAR